MPPYVLFSQINQIVGLNAVGLRRAAHVAREDRRQIKEAFKLLYRSGLSTGKALERMDECTDWGEPADRFRQFVRRVLTAEPPYKRAMSKIGSWTKR